jgi:hypothetical protein
MFTISNAADLDWSTVLKLPIRAGLPASTLNVTKLRITTLRILTFSISSSTSMG